MDTFQALADPTRRHILEILARRGRLSATEISDKFHMSPPAISQHLRVLRVSKLVTVEKKAQQRLYQINPHTIRDVQDWAGKMANQWNKRLDRLETLLQEKGGE